MEIQKQYNQSPSRREFSSTRVLNQAGVTCKLGVLCFYLSFVLVDSFVLRNPPERKGRTRYQTCKKKKKDDHDHKLMHIISVSKHSRDRNTETREINIESVFETKKTFWSTP